MHTVTPAGSTLTGITTRQPVQIQAARQVYAGHFPIYTRTGPAGPPSHEYYTAMTAQDNPERNPVVLVHGWNHHPGIWNRLCPLLEKEGVPVWKFDFSLLVRPSIPTIAEAFGRYMEAMQEETGYLGAIDIVCHSLGTCAARYYLEVMDGTMPVRQLIGLGAPNTGSALAELFFDKKSGPEIHRRLSGIFVPDGFNPEADPLVCDVRFESAVMQDLESAGLRNDITYRVVVTENSGRDPAFFPWFHGQTWERDENGIFRKTFSGDGIVSNRESALPGVTPDCISCTGPGSIPPMQYCHIHMPRNPAVMDHVLRLLRQP